VGNPLKSLDTNGKELTMLPCAVIPSRPVRSLALHVRGNSYAVRKALPSLVLTDHRIAYRDATLDESVKQPRTGAQPRANMKRCLSDTAWKLDSDAAVGLSSVEHTAKIFNESFDPLVSMTFVDSLSDKAKAELLDLILKSRGESGPEVDIFETGEARIRVEDYERLDTNRDGLISKEEFESYINSQKAKMEPPTREQLIMLATSSAVPFVGFGFMDNAIMILAGEAIETGIGATLTVSTMACAAIGNLISDVMGVGMGSYVEALARRMGFKEPSLTPEQMTLYESKYASNFGAATGVALGCFLGMFPLLFMGSEHEDEEMKRSSKT
jgi:hypothetical protein